MRSISRSLSASRAFLVLLALVFTQTALASGPTEQVIHSFGQPPDGVTPNSELAVDQAGNLYGTMGGGYLPNNEPGQGAVFELSPQTGGGWTYAAVYVFAGGDIDLAEPANGVTLDKSGNIYGMTNQGSGITNNSGAVYELSPPSTPGGAWKESVLYVFPGDGSQGKYPLGKLIFDDVGNLYGVTFGGGAPPFGTGTVFQLQPPATPGGTWTHNLLWTFGNTTDADEPNGDLVFHNGALYGVTQGGSSTGSTNGGTVFQLVQQSGTWTVNTLYNFDFPGSTDGHYPVGRLIVDEAGNLYGTTPVGGSAKCSCGTIYELSPPTVAGNPWQETILYNFTGQGDGQAPVAGLTRNKAGVLYGTARGYLAGASHTTGVVFQLKPPATSGGAWTETVLHRFKGSGAGDGSDPVGVLMFLNGALYGTTTYGGADSNPVYSNSGTVFSIVP